MSEHRFIFFYVTFLSFFLIVMGLGGTSYVASGYNITITPPPTPSPFNPLETLVYVIANIGLLFYLMVLNPFHPTVILLWAIIGIPALALLIYLVLRLIRGGG